MLLAAASRSLQARSRKAWDEGRPEVMAAFDRLGKAYLAFAKREPAYYSAMFEAGVPLDTDRELREASESAFAVLRAAAEKLVASMPSPGRPPALMVALHVWAMSHGDRLVVRPRRRGAPQACRCRRRNCWKLPCSFTCAASGLTRQWPGSGE